MSRQVGASGVQLKRSAEKKQVESHSDENVVASPTPVRRAAVSSVIFGNKIELRVNLERKKAIWTPLLMVTCRGKTGRLRAPPLPRRGVY